MSWNPHRKCTSLPTKGFLLLIGVGLPQTRPTFGSCNFKSSLLKHSLFGSVSAETKMITLPLASERIRLIAEAFPFRIDYDFIAEAIRYVLFP